MMLSELDLEDVEALHLGPSFLTADTLGPLLDHCEDALFGLSSLEEAPTSRPLSPLSPVHHASLSEAKGSDLTLPWFGASDLLDVQCPEEDDALLAMEWVSEKLELGELDLDSLLDSSDGCPESPEAQLAPCPQPDLLGSCSPIEPDLPLMSDGAVNGELPLMADGAVNGELPLMADGAVNGELPLMADGAVNGELPLMADGAVNGELPLMADGAVNGELPLMADGAVNGELPLMADGAVNGELPLMADGAVNSELPQIIVAAVKCEPLSPVHSLELGCEVDLSEKTSPSHSDCDSDSGIESSPPHTPQSCRGKPYSRPQPDRKPPRAKAPKTVEKKIKKMEQNKTAATRYRQKKRVEQEDLNTERLQLEQRNQELKDRAQAISREIQYLQDLMEEVRRHHQNKRGTEAK